jgi:sec-independent protein translocase protein TatB
MLDFAWSELMIIGVVTLVVVGPKDLPFVLRTAGRWMGKARAMAREFQNNVDDMIREAELHEVHKQIADMSKINPLAGIETSFDVNPYPAPALSDPEIAKPEVGPVADTPAPAPSPGSAEGAGQPDQPGSTASEPKA